MHTPTWLRRAATASAALTLAVGTVGIGVATTASAAPNLTALTSTDTTYLSDTLGLPTDTVVETVTYDRFQWLLQQPGQYVFVIGSAYSPGFADKVVSADRAAKNAGASRIYWFDPNLTGVEGPRNLDTRNPAGINLNADSQDAFAKVWTNVLGQYLGNGYKSTPDSRRTAVTVTADDSVINDAVDPVWDYRSTETPAVSSTDSILFVYDKDHTSAGEADKIVDWVNLTATNAAAVDSEVTAALASVGGAAIDSRSQFDWWESAANFKHDLAYPDDARYGGDILEDADNADGWRIQQVTYPELVHLLNKNGANDNFVLLFGGTWCHNTRAVLKQVNHEAQTHGVQTVYNFDLVLDGGTVNGSNSGSNPIHVRDHARTDTRPSYVYGDIVSTYFPNVVTEYDPASSGVSYYPGGDLNAATQTVRKGQVPFLLHYKHGTGATPSATAVQRQWIRDEGNGAYREYMSEWWFTNPSARLGLNFDISDESVLTSQQLDQLASARSKADFGAEAVRELGVFFSALPGVTAANPAIDAATVPFGSPADVTVTVPDTGGHAPSGTVTLTIDGVSYAAAISGNSLTFHLAGLSIGTHSYTVDYTGDPAIQDFSRSGTITVSKAVATVVGSLVQAPTPSDTGAYTAIVVGTPGEAQPSGTVTVTFTGASSTVTRTSTLAAGSATITIPALAAGTWNISVSYSGDSLYSTATSTGTLVINAPATVSNPLAANPVNAAAATTRPAALAADPAISVTVSSPDDAADEDAADDTAEVAQEDAELTTGDVPNDADATTATGAESARTSTQAAAEESEGVSAGIVTLGGLAGAGVVTRLVFYLLARRGAGI